MIANKPLEPSTNLADQAAQSADDAIRSTQRVANETLDSLAVRVQDIRHEASPFLNRATEQANALAQRGADAVRDTSQQLREKAEHVSDNTVAYIRDEPVKAMLIAAATGAALMALINLVSRSRHHA
jgi:ElaB/YqjD/DUF883 family membrane-anchored ribosome-binding protein